jgi:hypothetical protein
MEKRIEVKLTSKTIQTQNYKKTLEVKYDKILIFFVYNLNVLMYKLSC